MVRSIPSFRKMRAPHNALDRREALDGRRWTKQQFREYYGPEYGAHFWNQANSRVAEQHAVLDASQHIGRSTDGALDGHEWTDCCLVSMTAARHAMASMTAGRSC